jgi:L-fuconolactonase
VIAVAGPNSFLANPSKEDEWRECIAVLADCPNVHMKVGGLQMDGNGFKLGPGDGQQAPVSSDVLLAKTGELYNFMIDSFGAIFRLFCSH